MLLLCYMVATLLELAVQMSCSPVVLRVGPACHVVFVRSSCVLYELRVTAASPVLCSTSVHVTVSLTPYPVNALRSPPETLVGGEPSSIGRSEWGDFGQQQAQRLVIDSPQQKNTRKTA